MHVCSKGHPRAQKIITFRSNIILNIKLKKMEHTEQRYAGDITNRFNLPESVTAS